MDLVSAVAVVLAAVFIVSAAGKALRPRTFRRALANTYRVRAAVLPAVAWGVPIAELACAGLLVGPSTRVPGLLGASLILTSFSAVQATAWSMGLQGECGCFELLSHESLSLRTLIRAIGLAVTSWLALLWLVAT